MFIDTNQHLLRLNQGEVKKPAQRTYRRNRLDAVSAHLPIDFVRSPALVSKGAILS